MIFFLVTNFCNAQNLVPNGGFEQYSGCPGGGAQVGQLDSALYWINPAPWPPGGSPDYFHGCTTGFLNVPNAYFGYQQAHSGEAFCGLILWKFSHSDFREYIEAPLTSALIKDSCYHFEMYISSGDNVFNTDDIQVYFTDTAITGINNWNVLPYTPQIFNPTGNVPDTLNWTLVSGNYVSNGGEQFLVIGNFKNDMTTNVILVDSFGQFPNAYIYIDDVSLIQIASCVTSINETQDDISVKTYPNPFSDRLTIQLYKTEQAEIIIYDMTLRKLLQLKFTNSAVLNTERFAKGIYLYIVKNKNGVIKNGRLIKQ